MRDEESEYSTDESVIGRDLWEKDEGEEGAGCERGGNFCVSCLLACSNYPPMKAPSAGTITSARCPVQLDDGLIHNSDRSFRLSAMLSFMHSGCRAVRLILLPTGFICFLSLADGLPILQQLVLCSLPSFQQFETESLGCCVFAVFVQFRVYAGSFECDSTFSVAPQADVSVLR